jgi:mRNA interferase RelE/StbE
MSYAIKFYKEALKNIKKLDKTTRNRILDHINILAENPKNKELDIKKMQSTQNQFRLRVGSYRIVYSLVDEELIIIIVRVGSRGDVYKNL